jgi:hypothetical protein
MQADDMVVTEEESERSSEKDEDLFFEKLVYLGFYIGLVAGRKAYLPTVQGVLEIGGLDDDDLQKAVKTFTKDVRLREKFQELVLKDVRLRAKFQELALKLVNIGSSLKEIRSKVVSVTPLEED